MKNIKTIEFKDNILYLIDQRVLPKETTFFKCKDYRDVDFAINDMVVRGAPAIGATAAYGVVLAANEFMNKEKTLFLESMSEALDVLNISRPTAVNLMWAIKRMRKVINDNVDLQTTEIYDKIFKEADNIYQEDIYTNKTMAKHGNEIVKKGANILTHCNTGALATVEYGTALGVIREAHNTGKNIFVYADETRPRLQGGKLTAWELVQEGIPSKLIADSVAATLIRDGKVDVILVGADRIANNGDAANKIGTFMLSVVAKVYNVPFYIVAPTTTIDFEMESGHDIEIEERDEKELTHINGHRVAPVGIDVYNPAFDVTPHENITGIITEKGIINSPYKENIKKLKKEGKND